MNQTDLTSNNDNDDGTNDGGVLKVNFALIRSGTTFSIEFIAMSGIGVVTAASGSGKTTIFDCIAGLVAPSSGYIKLGGKTFFDADSKICLPPQERRIGYVLQRPSLFPHMTVRENVIYAMKDMNKEAIKTKLHELAAKFGIGALLDRNPRQISGGQAQRVAIVRAIAAKPELFLLDEPFSNLDDEARAEMIAAIKELRRVTAKPILYITHSASEASELADYRICGKNGDFRLGQTS